MYVHVYIIFYNIIYMYIRKYGSNFIRKYGRADLNNHKTNKHENMHVYIFFLACALSGYIFVNPFTFCVTDRYQYIIMETETNMKICMY